MTIFRILSAIAALTFSAQIAQAQDTTPATESSTLVETAPVIIAKVNGLVCDFCAQALNKVFKKQPSVESLDVNLDEGEVRITLKEGQSLSDETVKKLIRKSGYSLVSINRGGGA